MLDDRLRMILFLATLCASEVYPLLLGVSKETTAATPSSLAIAGTLPPNLCLFIVDQVEIAPFRTIQELSNWASAATVCEGVGKALTFPVVESNVFNFLDAVRNLYPPEMKIDTSDECPCAIKKYSGGLVIVRVPDNDQAVVGEVVQALPWNTAIAFISSTDNLFRY
jgi:hypothetical protein